MNIAREREMVGERTMANVEPWTAVIGRKEKKEEVREMKRFCRKKKRKEIEQCF